MAAWRLVDRRRIRYCKILCIDYVSCVLLAHIFEKGKVKCTLVQALSLCTGRTAHRGSRGRALLFLDHGTRRGWEVTVTPRALFTPGKDQVPIVQYTGWAQGRYGQVRKISPSTGIRSPDRPARSQSLYRLSYPTHTFSRARTISQHAGFFNFFFLTAGIASCEFPSTFTMNTKCLPCSVQPTVVEIQLWFESTTSHNSTSQIVSFTGSK